MSGEKITQDEMIEMFGEAMPWEAWRLLNSPDEMTVGEIRDKLRVIAREQALARTIRNSQTFKLLIAVTGNDAHRCSIDIANDIKSAFPSAIFTP